MINQKKLKNIDDVKIDYCLLGSDLDRNANIDMKIHQVSRKGVSAFARGIKAVEAPKSSPLSSSSSNVSELPDKSVKAREPREAIMNRIMTAR